MRFGRLSDVVEVLEVRRIDRLLLRVTYTILGGQSGEERIELVSEFG